jgi:Peptidase family M50
MKKPVKKDASYWIGTTIGVALPLLAIWKGSAVLWWIAGGLIVLPISIFLHELGHLIAGRAMKFRLQSFAIMPFQFFRRGDKWHLRTLRKTGVGGFVVMTPETAESLRERFWIMVAGGPAASLLSAAFFLLLVNLPAAEAWPHWPVLGCECMVFVDLLGAVTSLIPSEGNFTNDGHRLWTLRRPGPAADRFSVIFLLATSSISGVEPRYWNPELVALLPGPDDGSLQHRRARVFQYNYLIGSDRAMEAGRILRWLVEQDLPPLIRTSLQFEAAWFAARFDRNLEIAQAWFKEASRGGVDPSLAIAAAKARAGIAFLRQDWPNAETAAHEAIKECARTMDWGLAIVIEDRMKALLADIKSARAAAA